MSKAYDKSLVSSKKHVHVKPSFYAYNFQPLKEIALRYGFNLVLHESLARDMDLIAIPWIDSANNSYNMVLDFAAYLGGSIMLQGEEQSPMGYLPQGRTSYIINLNRKFDRDYNDPQWYLDISVTPYGKPIPATQG